MKKIFFVISSLFALFVLASFFVFFRYNSGNLTIDYLIGQIELSISTLTLIAFVCGVICALIVLIFGEIAMSWKILQQKSEIKYLKNQIEDLKKLVP